MNSRACLLKITRCYRRVVIRFKHSCKINLDSLSQIGKHWSQYGLLPRTEEPDFNWRLRSLLAIMVVATYVVKTSVMLKFDTFKSKPLAVICGDGFSFIAANKATWIYLKLSYVIANTYLTILFTFAITQSKPDTGWLDAIRDLKNVEGLSQKHSQKLCKIACCIQKAISCYIPLIFTLFSFASLMPYYLSLDTSQLLTLGVSHGVHFNLMALANAQVFAIQSLYFWLLCLFVTYSLRNVRDQLTRVMLLSTRNKWSYGFVVRQMQAINKAVGVIRSCNNFFSEKLKLLLAAYLSVTLAYTYSLSNAVHTLDYIVICWAITYCIGGIAFFFISASFVKVEVNHCYITLNSILQKRIPFRLRWQMMLMTEFLATRKKRVIFQLKN